MIEPRCLITPHWNKSPFQAGFVLAGKWFRRQPTDVRPTSVMPPDDPAATRRGRVMLAVHQPTDVRARTEGLTMAAGTDSDEIDLPQSAFHGAMHRINDFPILAAAEPLCVV